MQKPSLTALNDLRIHVNLQLIGSIWCEKINFQVKMNGEKDIEAFGKQDKHWSMVQI